MCRAVSALGTSALYAEELILDNERRTLLTIPHQGIGVYVINP